MWLDHVLCTANQKDLRRHPKWFSADQESYELTNTDDPCWLHRRIVQDALSHILVQMCTVVVCLDCISPRIVCVRMEGVQMCADPLHWLEALPLISVQDQQQSQHRNSLGTWTAAAPVSSVLFIKLSGSPAVLLVTGSESTLWQTLSDIVVLLDTLLG